MVHLHIVLVVGEEDLEDAERNSIHGLILIIGIEDAERNSIHGLNSIIGSMIDESSIIVKFMIHIIISITIH